MSNRIRVVAILTHPVQYLTPWFRHIHACAPELEFKVVYATEPTAAQQGIGFGQAFEWDVPLRTGYDSIVVKAATDATSLDSDSFLGVDVREVIEAARSFQPHAVLVPGWHSATQVRALRAFHREGLPLLYRGDSHLGTMSRRWPRLSRLRARLMLRHYSGYLAVGTRSREYLLALGVPEPAIVSSPHAVDNEAFRLRADAARPHREELRRGFGGSADDRIVLYVGKLSSIKRPADVIDAVGLMGQSLAVFVGDGPEKAALETRARAAGVRCVFAGFMNQQQIADAYVAADALMLPGRETWGLVANEALACGLPVVMSDEVGAAPDLAHDGVAVSVPRHNPAAFADALTRVIDGRRHGDSSVQDCYKLIDRFSYAEATRGLVMAAMAVDRNRKSGSGAPVRVVALAGNLVFAGGMERITFEALGALRRGGADVHAMLNGWSSRPIAELAEQRGITWEVGHYDAPLDGVFRSPVKFARALTDVLRASGHLLRVIRRCRATHVFAADFRAVLLHAPALLMCRLLGVDVCLRSGVAPTQTHVHRLLWRWVIGPLVNRHFANSNFTAAELRAASVTGEHIVTIYNVAPKRDSTMAQVSRVDGRIAYVGQVIPEKGVLQLVDAIGLLTARGYDVTLDVAGQMEGWAPDAVHRYRSALRSRALATDLQGRVRFLGWREDIDAVLAAASIHCCPSQPEQREGFGITVVEAKRAGIPSVVCPSGALPELIEHKVDGWVATAFDAASIAEGIGWLLSDPARLNRAQRAARESGRRFDPVVFDERWQEAFGMRRGRRQFDGAGRAVVDLSGVSR
jgi:glycosyltransferase involved in cell wall biosynthesis